MNSPRPPKVLMTAKLFTPVEANLTLPLVRSIVSDILEKASELRGRTALSKAPDEDPELELIRQDILDLMQEIESLGATYKDWDFQIGLVDFPAKIDGREVLLCWRSDESKVGWFHAPEAGFAGRRPIPGHLLDEK